MNNLIIAIGDLHGHYRALERILDAAQKKYGISGADGGHRAMDAHAAARLQDPDRGP
jgi:hypothetical protein